MARYERSFENLQEIRDSTRDLISRVESRLDRVESIIKEMRSSHDSRLSSHDSRLDRLEKRLRLSDTKTLAVYEGNLIIKLVKRLSDNHDIEAEIRGDDPEGSKKKLAEAAETLINEFGTAKQVNGRITETKAEIESRWQAATGLSPKYMKAMAKFEEKVETSDFLAYETAGQLAQLLMEEEHFKTYRYYNLSLRKNSGGDGSRGRREGCSVVGGQLESIDEMEGREKLYPIEYLEFEMMR